MVHVSPIPAQCCRWVHPEKPKKIDRPGVPVAHNQINLSLGLLPCTRLHSCVGDVGACAGLGSGGSLNTPARITLRSFLCAEVACIRWAYGPATWNGTGRVCRPSGHASVVRLLGGVDRERVLVTDRSSPHMWHWRGRRRRLCRSGRRRGPVRRCVCWRWRAACPAAWKDRELGRVLGVILDQRCGDGGGDRGTLEPCLLSGGANSSGLFGLSREC